MAEVWPEELELELHGIAQGGDAVGRRQGRAVFAAGGLPGERVRVRLRDRQAAFARGQVIEVLDAVPERRASPCPLEERCGAADWRWIDYAAQLRYKQTILQEQFLHLGGLEVTVAHVHGMTAADTPGDGPQRDAGPGWGYRTTAELHIADGRAGYFAPNTRHVEDVPQCCLHHPLLNTAVAGLRGLLAAHPELRGVTIRCAPASGDML